MTCPLVSDVGEISKRALWQGYIRLDGRNSQCSTPPVALCALTFTCRRARGMHTANYTRKMIAPTSRLASCCGADYDKSALLSTREAALHVRQINDPNFEGNCMLRPSHLSQRKRACSEQHLGQQSAALLPAKRRKDDHSSELSAKFWDNLSQIHLTKRALKELNWRNTQAVQSASRTTQRQSSTTSERGRALCLRKPDPKTFKA